MRATPSHPRERKQLDRLFSAGLSPDRHQQLWRHLRACADCRGYYERLRVLEEAADPNELLSQAAIERLTPLVIPAAPASRQRPWLLAVLSVASAGVAIVLFLAIAPPLDSGSGVEASVPSEYRAPRGAPAEPVVAALSVFHIVDPGAQRIQRLARSARGMTVSSGAVIQLAYRNESFARAVVLGIDAEGTIQWYHPAKADLSSGGVALSPGVVDEPFGVGWRITAPAGPLRLFAVFSDERLDLEAIEQAAADLTQGGASVRDAERLAGIHEHQDTILIEVSL